MFIFVLLFVNNVNAAEVPEGKTLKVGMPFEEAQVLLEEVGARETQLDMVYLGDGEEKLYYLPDDRHISIILNEKEGEKVITNLSSFRINAEVPKGDPEHFKKLLDNAREIELNKINLIIESDKETYRPGEKIELSVKFKNVSDSPLLLNKYMLNMKLLQQIELESRYEGIYYKILDMTKYKLPQILPEDFIRLELGQNYEEKLTLDTILPSDSAFWYKTKNTTQEGIKELPDGSYYITVEYENIVYGLLNNGLPINNKDHLKADKNIFVGTLVSNSIEISLER